MDKLPLEIKEHIVWRTIWAPQPFDPKKEKWEDGPLKLELAEFHPLPHYLGHGENTRDATDPEKSLVALMGTSKEFKRICDQFTNELLVAYETFDWECDCVPQQGSDHACDSTVPTWSFSIGQGKPNARTKVFSVIADGAAEEEVVYFRKWRDCIFSPIRALGVCSSLTSLSVTEHTLGWLLPILAALPGRGSRLEQLALAYPEHRSRSSEEFMLEDILSALSGCTGVRVLTLDHHWPIDVPQFTRGPAFIIRTLQALGASLSNVRISHLAGWDDATLGGKTATELLQQPLALNITRLAIVDALIQSDIVQGIVEASHRHLEYFSFDGTDFDTAPQPGSRAVRFTRLRHAIVSLADTYDEMPLGATVLPEHWQLPALCHLEASWVDLSGNGSVKAFMDRIRSWPTLRSLRIRGDWSWNGLVEDLDREDDWWDKERGVDWVEIFGSSLQESGVDVDLSLHAYAE